MYLSRSILFFSFLISVFFWIGIAQAKPCLDCNPQCVKYARDRSGIPCRGDAGTWGNCSAAKHTKKPKKGYVIVLSDPEHLIYVEKGDNDCENDKCSIQISHANWSNGCECGKECCIEENITARYNMEKSTLTIKGGRLPGKYKVSCILKKKK